MSVYEGLLSFHYSGVQQIRLPLLAVCNYAVSAKQLTTEINSSDPEKCVASDDSPHQSFQFSCQRTRAGSYPRKAHCADIDAL